MSITVHAPVDEPAFILTFDARHRAPAVGTLGGRLRIFLDTALFASAIEPRLSDAELRDYESGADEVRIG